MKVWLLPTLGTFICWGLWSYIPKITTRYIDPKSAIIYEVIGGFFLSIVVLYFMDFRLETHPKGMALAATAGLLGFLGALCFLFAVTKGAGFHHCTPICLIPHPQCYACRRIFA